MIQLANIESILKDAARRLELKPQEELGWYAWPQTWGDSSCGFDDKLDRIVRAQTVVVALAGFNQGSDMLVYHNSRFAYRTRIGMGVWQMVMSHNLPGRVSARISLSIAVYDETDDYVETTKGKGNCDRCVCLNCPQQKDCPLLNDDIVLGWACLRCKGEAVTGCPESNRYYRGDKGSIGQELSNILSELKELTALIKDTVHVSPFPEESGIDEAVTRTRTEIDNVVDRCINKMTSEGL